jgi:hypothetical protein
MLSETVHKSNVFLDCPANFKSLERELGNYFSKQTYFCILGLLVVWWLSKLNCREEFSRVKKNHFQ